jgi:predicted RND superfamily exporter protein
MKKLIIRVFLIVVLLISSVSFAQGINKISLLNELNKTYGVELNTVEKNNFENINSELVSGLFSLDKNDLSTDNRNKEIDKLFDKRDKSLTVSLGIDKYSDIKSQANGKIEQTAEKVKSAKKLTP